MLVEAARLAKELDPVAHPEAQRVRRLGVQADHIPLPELKHVQADLAIVPIALGQGTMSIDDAASYLNTMRPRWVVPSHWGTLNGTQLDVQMLENALDEGISVVVHETVR